MTASGTSVVEALVAALLAGAAAAALAATAAVAVPGLRLAREVSVAVALATERLEALRAGPRDDGADRPVVDRTTFARTWRVVAGRGIATRIDVRVVWGSHGVALATEAWP